VVKCRERRMNGCEQGRSLRRAPFFISSLEGFSSHRSPLRRFPRPACRQCRAGGASTLGLELTPYCVTLNLSNDRPRAGWPSARQKH
jgi:hypothetical protein